MYFQNSKNITKLHVDKKISTVSFLTANKRSRDSKKSNDTPGKLEFQKPCDFQALSEFKELFIGLLFYTKTENPCKQFLQPEVIYKNLKQF